MQTKQLKVVAKPDSDGSVVSGRGFDTIIKRGDGDHVFVCGGCRASVAIGVDEHELAGTVYLCPRCGVYSELPD